MLGLGMVLGYFLGREDCIDSQEDTDDVEYETLVWDEKEVKKYIKKHPRCTKEEISKIFQVTPPEAQLMLRVLMRNTRLKREKDENQIYRYYF